MVGFVGSTLINPVSRLRQGKRSSQPNRSKRISKPPGKRLVVSLSLIAGLSFGFGGVLAFCLNAQILNHSKKTAETMATTPILSVIPNQITRPVTVLVLGIDQGRSLRNPANTPETVLDGNSDTMLLVRFDPSSGQATVLSIPRDTKVPLTGSQTQKINDANALGGPPMAARTVSQLLEGIGIDRYVRLDTQALIHLVDVLDGVDINVPAEMHYRDRTQGLTIDFQPGLQHLSGQHLEEYVRFRHDGMGDIGRVQRQQGVLNALLRSVITPTAWIKLPQLLQVTQDSVDTNLSVEEMLALLNFLKGSQEKPLKTVMLPGRFSTPDEYDYSYWIPDVDKIHLLLSQNFS